MSKVITPHEENRQEELHRFLVNWLICDSYPFSIVQSEYFCKFINELDPSKFNISSVKFIKQIIHKVHNFSVSLLKEDLKNNSIKVSFTMDFWTSYNRKGYIEITCSYIDKNFKLNEITLLIQYLPYSHTSRNIHETLNTIIKN